MPDGVTDGEGEFEGVLEEVGEFEGVTDGVTEEDGVVVQLGATKSAFPTHTVARIGELQLPAGPMLQASCFPPIPNCVSQVQQSFSPFIRSPMRCPMRCPVFGHD